jgi:Na+/proline symporter
LFLRVSDDRRRDTFSHERLFLLFYHEHHTGFGIAVIISIIISFIVGVATYFWVKGKSVNFFVAGRSLPLWVVAMTLGAQSIDSNAILGNADLSYRYGFWDGAVIPIGLGLSLILNGVFLAHHINEDELLTLPDAFSKRYGKVVEVLVSLCTVCSFIMLLAGNLVSCVCRRTCIF